MRKTYVLLAVILMTCVTAVILALQHSDAGGQRMFSPGYEDTPMLPGTKWHVHDPKRPQARVVAPGTCSTQDKPGRPPSDAIILFDGKDLSKWQTVKGEPAPWKMEKGYLEVVPKSGDIYTREKFGNIQLHVEWLEPVTPPGQTPPWGNSGVFLYGAFEVQVWDSYHTQYIYSDGEAGAMYGQYPPLVNACRKDGEWQEYDIIFSPPHFAGGKLATPAYVTVFQNGVVIHNHVALLGETGHRVLPPYVDRGPEGPVRLQDHGDPVRYRNIWVRRLKGYDQP